MMKHFKRLPYLELAKEVDYCVCSFCRYGDYSGSPCSYGEYGCDHPLPRVYEELSEGVQCDGPGKDCWAFRPNMKIEMAADIVGVILANGYKSTTWNLNDDGNYEVAGIAQGEY